MRELTKCQLIERSIQKKYRRKLWSPFIVGIKRYQLINEGDRIAVCLSGGKDSMLLAKLMQELCKYSDVSFHVEYLVMDPGYSPANRQKIEDNAALMNIPIKIFESEIFAITETVDRSACYLCAKMRRGHLYSYARELGCNKIALGHHYDDVVETILMSLLYGGRLQTMMPKLRSANFPGLELIRPLYLVREEDIIAWKNHNGLDFLKCACRFTEACESSGDGIGPSKRQEIKMLIHQLSHGNPSVSQNIFNSVHALSLDTIIGWTKGEKEHSFLDDY